MDICRESCAAVDGIEHLIFSQGRLSTPTQNAYRSSSWTARDPVKAGYSVWQHLQVRDGWDQTPDTGDDQAFMMVQAMETWFLADRDLLKRYFGAKFRENALKQWPKLEGVPKRTVLSALESSTINCAKRYAKGKVSFELLALVDPALVEAACPHAKALLDRLRTLLR